MKQRLTLFLLCLILLAGVLYWLVPKATALNAQINAMGTVTVEPTTPTATTPTTGEARPKTQSQAATIDGLSTLAYGYLCGLSHPRSDRL